MRTLAAEFEHLTGEYFTFLESDFGFKKCPVDASQIRYETKDVYVVVGYDLARSYELSVDLGNTASLAPPFNLGEVLRYAKAPPEIASSYQVTSHAVLHSCLEKLAQALWKYGTNFLRNDRNAFVQLASLRARESDEFELESRLRNGRSTAEMAWQKKDYGAVVAALAPLSSCLSAADKKRLEYAKKHSPNRIDRR